MATNNKFEAKILLVNFIRNIQLIRYLKNGSILLANIKKVNPVVRPGWNKIIINLICSSIVRKPFIYISFVSPSFISTMGLVKIFWYSLPLNVWIGTIYFGLIASTI